MRINIRTENDAFVGNEETELSRILRELADKIGEGNRPREVQDINGNKVGTVEYE